MAHRTPRDARVGTIHQLLTGQHQDDNALSGAAQVTFQEGLAQFAQYVLMVCGALWFSRRGSVATA